MQVNFWWLRAYLFCLFLSTTTALAQTEKTIHNFLGAPVDGQSPIGSVIADNAGNLYGTTYYGGSGACSDSIATGCGIVFELSPQKAGGYLETILHEFKNDGKDGFYPAAGLVLDTAGNLYGTASYGGSGSCGSTMPTGCGVVFRLSRTHTGRWRETILHNFAGGSDGQQPLSSLVIDGKGHIFGTTNGNRSGCEHSSGECGTVFEISHTLGGWAAQVVHSFNFNGVDGFAPNGPLVLDKNGNLFGGTSWGGAFNDGCAFKLSPNADGSWTEDILFDTFFWKGLNGGGPSQVLLDDKGNLFGVSSTGGTSYSGEVFELSPASGGSWTEMVLFDFNIYGSGAAPNILLVFDRAGNLYGTTANGIGTSGMGTVFQLTPSTAGMWTITTLHSFGSTGDGQLPRAGLLPEPAGNLFGTTSAGGSHGAGTVFVVKH